MGVFSSPIVAGLAKVVFVVVSLGGLTTGAYFAYQTTRGDDGDPSGQAIVTGSPMVIATPTQPAPSATQPPLSTPTATTGPPTQAPPAPTATADTRVPIRDLPTPDQIQLTKDGTYYIPDRGDGCIWTEYLRESGPPLGPQVFFRTDCPVEFGLEYRPQSGEVFVILS